MNPCDEIEPKLQLLVDGELIPEEQEIVFAHLEGCQACQREFEERESFSARIREARPQTHAPASLRTRVESTLRQGGGGARSQNKFEVHRGGRWADRGMFWLGVAAVLFVTVGSALFVRNQHQHQSQMTRNVAIRAQRDLEQGRLPLDIMTDSEAQISSWLSLRVDFAFRMADDGIASAARAKYTLSGARLMTVNGERAALVSFRLPDELNQQVSMIVGPETLPVDTSGASIRSGGLKLYPRDEDEMHVVSWKNRRLTYVLVSRTPMNSANTCGRCHQGGTTAQEKHSTVAELEGPSSSIQLSTK